MSAAAAPNEATARQIAAADPAGSAWVSANAGSGKTRVLTDRVARLLLGGTRPQRILCLTYTKAAAAEMQNRLFRRLGEWAMLDDDALAEMLAGLGAPVGGASDLARARTLFASAIETPGGLKIQTIHAFCAALLRRFPLEAGVPPHFREMEDQAARMLRADLLDRIADSPDGDVIDGVARQLGGGDLAPLAEAVAGKADLFEPPADAATIRGWFGLAPHQDEEALLAQCFDGSEAALIARILPVLQASAKPTDHKTADRLAALDLARPDMACLRECIDLLLTGKSAKEPFSAKIGSLPTKACGEALGPDLDHLHALMRRVEAGCEPLRALDAAERTAALHRFAGIFLPAYQRAKLARGFLDFDDLIRKARHLLTDSAAAQWVLYRMDGGIDHVLVDEAQDTAPAQWEVIRRLAEEFTAGTSARDGVARTLFVVGDLKQSIYSFQGADPAEFGRSQRHFEAAYAGIGQPLSSMELAHSFRSSPAILRCVDTVFEQSGGKGLGKPPGHLAFHPDMPGRVDLWPAVPDPETPEPADWQDPVDLVAPNDAAVQLGRMIARQIEELLAGASLSRADGSVRRVVPGDILILVQRRSALFDQIITACKSRGLPLAGADRMRLGAELAVRDISALLRFLTTPEDDLSLAATLRSPLFGLSEGDLYTLAQSRGRQYLWPRLQESAARFPQACATLRDLRDRADYLRPFDLIERLLVQHGGRARLLARLGDEAEEGIDALLAQALAYERGEVPSLAGFLSWLDSGEQEIKRQPDSAGAHIRVMTVHGAKGLEAPIVILPDTAKRKPSAGGPVIDMGDGRAAWRMPADAAPVPLRAAQDASREAQEEERQRLLYVALTRAESWLIVAAAGETGEDMASWHAQIAGALDTLQAAPLATPAGTGMRFEMGSWPEQAEAAQAPPAEAPPALPPWAHQPAPPPPAPPQVLTPSGLGGAKALFAPGTDPGAGDEDAAMRRGRMLHLLLEHLPGAARDDWPALAEALLSGGEDVALPEELPALVDEAARVLDAPDLAFLFGPGTLAEIGIAAPLPGGARVRGIIDRIVVAPDHVLAVDFKTNAIVPPTPAEVPEGLLRQMGAYEQALAQIYPGKRIDTALLWTRSAQLMRLPHEIVRAASLPMTTS